jgi:hypothetical protein
MIDRILVAAIAWLGCGCARSPAGDASRGHAASPASGAIASPAPLPAKLPAAPAAVVAPAPPELSVTPIETGFAAGAVLGWPVDNDMPGASAVVLFPEELAAVRRAVASSLARRGIALVPIAELERIEAAAATGELVLEGNQVCASPLSRDEVHARYFAARPEVRIEAACFDDCRLTVTVERGPDEVDYFTSGKVLHPEDPQRWVAAAARLKDEAYGIGGLRLSGTSHNPPIRFASPSWAGAWPAPPTDEQLRTLEPSATRCAHPDAAVGLSYAIRARVDRHGRIDRCVAAGPKPLARAVDEACLCEVIGELRFTPGSGKRRLRVEAIDDPGASAMAGAWTMLQPGTEPWVERLGGAFALERCAAAHPLAVAVDAVVSLRLAASGKVEDVRIDGAIVDAGAMQWARCLVGELGALALPCRPPCIEVLRAKLVIAGR